MNNFQFFIVFVTGMMGGGIGVGMIWFYVGVKRLMKDHETAITRKLENIQIEVVHDTERG